MCVTSINLDHNLCSASHTPTQIKSNEIAQCHCNKEEQEHNVYCVARVGKWMQCIYIYSVHSMPNNHLRNNAHMTREDSPKLWTCVKCISADHNDTSGRCPIVSFHICCTLSTKSVLVSSSRLSIYNILPQCLNIITSLMS